ncbi:MAG: carbohydrate binding domain-containing protein [Verrucomicrobiales bacterium]|nr:carbohydrate binding domain-containing protein [Verrucomicrobiales bacterium]
MNRCLRRPWSEPVALPLARLAGLTTLLLHLAAATAEIVPFVLPWDDVSQGPTDLSSLNRPIEESTRVIVDADGHFRAGQERIRFLGVNFAGDSPFMPTNKADAVAGRLAKFGVNSVRFHHMDAPWATGGGLLRYTTTSSREIQPAQLERVHYLVAALARRGIYANLNLLVGREYRRGDGLGDAITTLDWKDQHLVGLVNDTALQWHKEYATRLLTPTNRFTGLPLARDPAVAFVEILNENGLIQKWYEGNLDAWPAVLAGDVQMRWNRWLAERYTDEAALLAAWKPLQLPLQANLLRNGSFSSGTSSWNLEQHAGAAAAVARTLDNEGTASARITVTKPGTEGWHVQFNQPAIPVAQGQLYTLTFAAKADRETQLDVAIMQAHEPWQTIGFAKSFAIGTQWRWFTNTLFGTPTVALDSNARVNFGGMGSRTGVVWVADVRFQKGGQVGQPPAGTSLNQGNLPPVLYAGDGFTGTPDIRRDWIRFLRDTEIGYYDAMAGHLRTNCGYPGLIFGTIMANSPASVQSRLDVIDGHAYWQHPQFPATPWDPIRWTVANVPLFAASPEANPLALLARQRLQGKPFTVTEYQHSSPNSFGAEGPLLLAAQASAQDWDGLWLFDYGPGNDSVAMGKFRGFFDIAQHPTKMANLLLAAHLFRRGDAQPLANQIVLNLRPEQEIDLLLGRASAWSVFHAGLLGLPDPWSLTNRVAVAYGDNPTGLDILPETPPASGPQQTQWHQAGTNRWVTVQTPRTRVALGHLGAASLDLGELSFQVTPQQMPFATIGATVTTGRAFTNGTFVLVASGWIENTGMRWTDATKTSVGNQWGSGPTLIEVIPFRLSLPVAAGRVRAWSLDERGQRKASIPIQAPGADTSVLAPPPGTATLWYEVEVSGPTSTAFEDWRRLEFGPEELADPRISGPEAAPAGDGIPNLTKYAFGLPAKKPANRRDLASWGVRSTPVGPVLWLAHPSPPNSADARIETLASSSLGGWQKVESTPREGGEQRESLLPIAPDSPATGFLKLQVRAAGP